MICVQADSLKMGRTLQYKDWDADMLREAGVYAPAQNPHAGNQKNQGHLDISGVRQMFRILFILNNKRLICKSTEVWKDQSL